MNETHNVRCLCGRDAECGCDDVRGTDLNNYVQSVVGNGSWAAMQQNGVRKEKGNSTLVIDGSLDNGTTAAGGSDDTTQGSGAMGRGRDLGMVMLVALVASGIMIV